MVDYTLLASSCDIDPQCPKIARAGATGVLAVVGHVITDPESLVALGVGPGEGAVQITEALYRAGHDNL